MPRAFELEPSTTEVLIVSQHLKEQIIAPIVEPLGFKFSSIQGFNTDTFGTFAGEIPRVEGPKITVREKCLAGIKFSGARAAIASEGSFGPHPQIPFLTINEEWLVFIDLEKKLEIYAKAISTELCFEKLSAVNTADLQSFLNRIDFPKQGLVLKNTDDQKVIEKGIQDIAQLQALLEKHKSNWLLETDLRAHQNPLRRKNIASAAQDLVARLQARCPICQTPDFSVVRTSGALLCSCCKAPSSSYATLHFACRKCGHKEIQQRTDKQAEDPGFCDHCNP
ncbi:MAG: hypothetical protein RLZZ65_334 [Bacteroidota bacterium]|jgi:hypothetical protein